jgi:hypothetical protein
MVDGLRGLGAVQVFDMDATVAFVQHPHNFRE